MFRTAKQLLFFYVQGILASHTLARHDLKAMNKYESLIKQAAQNLCVDPAIIAGKVN